jgi:hypothetical protein
VHHGLIGKELYQNGRPLQIVFGAALLFAARGACFLGVAASRLTEIQCVSRLLI